MTLRSLSILSATLLSFGLVAAACGNDDDETGIFDDNGTGTPAAIDTPTAVDDTMDDAGTTPDPITNGEETVSITDGMFDPSTLMITTGTTVRFSNDGVDTVQITVNRTSVGETADGVNDDDDDNGLFNDDDDELLSEELDAGDTAEHTFDEAGTYEVTSDTDPGLRMTITVQ